MQRREKEKKIRFLFFSKSYPMFSLQTQQGNLFTFFGWIEETKTGLLTLKFLFGKRANSEVAMHNGIS